MHIEALLIAIAKFDPIRPDKKTPRQSEPWKLSSSSAPFKFRKQNNLLFNAENLIDY